MEEKGFARMIKEEGGSSAGPACGVKKNSAATGRSKGKNTNQKKNIQQNGTGDAQE